MSPVSATTVLMARNWSSLLGMAGFLERVAGPQLSPLPARFASAHQAKVGSVISLPACASLDPQAAEQL
jgi:hypothetical protein